MSTFFFRSYFLWKHSFFFFEGVESVKRNFLSHMMMSIDRFRRWTLVGTTPHSLTMEPNTLSTHTTTCRIFVSFINRNSQYFKVYKHTIFRQSLTFKKDKHDSKKVGLENLSHQAYYFYATPFKNAQRWMGKNTLITW